MSADAHVVMGGALSFLVVFRTNASYDRWWEARCAWQTVVTTCRSIAAQIAPALRDEASVERCLMQLINCTLQPKVEQVRARWLPQPRRTKDTVLRVDAC